MKVMLKPIIRRMLPLASATAFTLMAVANPNKVEQVTDSFNNVEYLQPDTFEKKGADRIEVGLSQSEAYKNDILKSKFDQANLNGDYVIDEEEARIYNWKKGNDVLELPNGVLVHGLTLKGYDRFVNPKGVYPSFYIYPGQEYNNLKLPEQRKLFKKIDNNNNETVSPMEILRYLKGEEVKSFDTLIDEASSEIVDTEKYMNNKMDYIDWGKSVLLALGAFLGTVSILSLSSKTKKTKLPLSVLMALTTAGGSVGMNVVNNNKKYDFELKEALKKKENAVAQKEQSLKELNYLDEQLRLEN